MRELVCMFVFFKFWFFCYGYDGKLIIVINLWIGLMGLFEIMDFISCINILLFVFYFFCLGSLEIYILWVGYGRISIFCREFKGRLCIY